MSPYGQFHSEQRTLRLTARGETDEAALNQILTQMRQQVLKEVDGPVLFMAPVDVVITERQASQRTERFLGLLWPRQRQQVTLTAELTLEVRWLSFRS